ncbi:MAG TPA: Lpg1974 family pore-forming outer membrane protein [Urbifossiella sp.]|nr:Lpg1974 family pore-forming outer membrane protein [Urbifossiella sp.]
MLGGGWRSVAALLASGAIAAAAMAQPPSALPPVPPTANASPIPASLSPPPNLPIRDLTPSQFAADAPAPSVYPNMPGHLTPAAPAEGGPFATAELLIMRPHRGALDFAIPSDATGLVPSGNVASLNYDLQPGFRGELGHRFGGSGWEAYFGYTYFHSSAEDCLHAPAGFAVFPTLTKPGLVDTVQSAMARANFNYNVYDMMLAKRFAVDDHLALRMSGGLRFANISQSFDAVYNGIDANAATVSANSSFQGFGPIFGGEAMWAGWKGFHLYARGNVGLLSGQSNNPLVETNNGGQTIYANTAYNIHTVAPLASMGIGGGWQYRTVFVRMGYEITNYWNVVNQPRFVDDVGVGKLTTRTSNISLEGLFLQAGLVF